MTDIKNILALGNLIWCLKVDQTDIINMKK